MMRFTQFMDHVAQAFEALGAAVLVVGLVWSAVVVVRTRRTETGQHRYQAVRETFGGALLLALEILVAADLIRTVAVTPTLASVGVLGLIVIIRTFLSFSLQIEIEGVLPWQRASATGRGAISRSSGAQAARGPTP
jgi:uncharacterized membrane protein